MKPRLFAFMIGPPKDTNLQYEHKHLPEEVAGVLGVPENFNQESHLHLVTKEDIEDERIKKEQEAQHLEVIKRIDNKLLTANLEKIRVVDIKKLGELDYVYICQNIRNSENGKVDWQYVKDRLSKENQERFPLRKFRNFEIAIEELRENLLRDRPVTFSAVYVEKNYTDIHAHLTRDARKENKKIDWNFIAHRLEDLECKFVYEHIHIEKEKAIKLLVGILNENEGEVNIEYIATINPPLYEHFRYNYNGGYGYTNWEEVKNLLPLDLKDKLKLPKDYFKRKYIARLNDYILKSESEFFSPTNIKSSHLLNKIRMLFRDSDGNVDWHRVAKRLSPEAKIKFKHERTKKSALIELNDLIERENPKEISYRLIQRLNPNLLEFLRKNFRNKSGRIDWVFIVKNLNPKFRDRFIFPVNHNYNTPKESYEDMNEVDKNLVDLKKYLYTFIDTNPDSTGETNEKRNEICMILIDLAKKGNINAERELINLISYLADRWIEALPNFKVWDFHKDRLHETIRRCVYNYQPKGPFVGYVFKSLKMAALGLERVKEISFEDHINSRHGRSRRRYLQGKRESY